MKKYIKILLTGMILAFMGAACLLFGCAGEQEPELYRVVYTAGRGGQIEGEAEQTVKRGEDAQTVTAVADEGYRFLKWSDGRTRAVRIDIGVSENIAVEAQFQRTGNVPEVKDEYTLTYVAGAGGRIEGEAEQTVKRGENAQAVTAVPDEGYKFVRWSDKNGSARRQDENVNADQTLTAEFEKITFTVRYVCDVGMISLTMEDGKGYAGADIEFQVGYGEDSKKVVAVKSHTYGTMFIGWADGIETEERQEKEVYADITVRAKVGYELTYRVAGESGGTIPAGYRQVAEMGEESPHVEAVPDEGYVFCGWSDLSAEAVHYVEKAERSLEYVAYFEPIKKSFRYEYGAGFGAPLATEITLDRGAIGEAEFVVPQREGYTFCGWYADEGYTVKVVHGSGKLMLGYRTFALQTDALYARWEKVGEEPITYKVLMIAVDPIDATLYSEIAERDIHVNHGMTAIEREACEAIADKFSYYLNKWFEGRVIFEVDRYYTLRPLTEESFILGYPTDYPHYRTTGWIIKEIHDIIKEYECTMTSLNLLDYDSLLHSSSVMGMGEQEHGMVYLDNRIFPAPDKIPGQYVVEKIRNYYEEGGTIDKYELAAHYIKTYLHEFAHTIEMRYYYPIPGSGYDEEVYDFHKWVAESWSAGYKLLETIRLYLLHEAGLGGERVGIPPSYWEKFYTNKEVENTMT